MREDGNIREKVTGTIFAEPGGDAGFPTFLSLNITYEVTLRIRIWGGDGGGRKKIEVVIPLHQPTDGLGVCTTSPQKSRAEGKRRQKLVK